MSQNETNQLNGLHAGLRSVLTVTALACVSLLMACGQSNRFTGGTPVNNENLKALNSLSVRSVSGQIELNFDRVDYAWEVSSMLAMLCPIDVNGNGCNIHVDPSTLIAGHGSLSADQKDIHNLELSLNYLSSIDTSGKCLAVAESAFNNNHKLKIIGEGEILPLPDPVGYGTAPAGTVSNIAPSVSEPLQLAQSSKSAFDSVRAIDQGASPQDFQQPFVSVVFKRIISCEELNIPAIPEIHGYCGNPPALPPSGFSPGNPGSL